MWAMWWRLSVQPFARRAEEDVFVVPLHHVGAEVAQELDDLVGPSVLVHHIPSAEEGVDFAHELEGALQARQVAVDVRNDTDSHSKIEVTTSSMLRCTSRSSVRAQVMATWHARRGAIPLAMSFPA